MIHGAITFLHHLYGYSEPIKLRLITAWRLVPFSTSTLWRKIRRGEFPVPVKVSDLITARRVGQMRQWLKDPARYQQAQHEPLLPGGRNDR